MKAYYDSLNKCGERYYSMVSSDTTHNNHELTEFIKEFLIKVAAEYPLMKLNRWLGYIQGCIIERGLTTVTAERDWTRSLFRPLDFES
jgi:hypothetical protein